MLYDSVVGWFRARWPLLHARRHITDCLLLFSEKELKKTSMSYFPFEDLDD